ncbi:MAG: hypothetical protein A2583_07200 [Bdellovibrionales bacterium RIFOXYD1_FULL_53_11]|nr:MAG: hypothetical protein A2583_07200 [Bdellovibrionales bacterium RIFOXYD1_FULL_53_11]
MNREILGTSQVIRDLREMILRIAPSKTNVLIIGESGTGKELIARMIHNSGPLKDEAFVPVNCGAIPENLIESEMFGHKRGSFTGAVGDKKGLFEAANGGTLFLDEVGELPVGMQVKLLRAIQEKAIRKVGGNETHKIDVRIIAATNRDLESGIAKGTFREDLYYRLNVIQLKAPPLRERRGDVRMLAESFLQRFSERQGKRLEGFDQLVLAVLEAYSWPGNVRELENVIERAVTLASDGVIGVSALPPGFMTVSMAGGVILEKNPADAKSPGAGVDAGGEIRLPAPDFSKGPIELETVLGEVERIYLGAALEYAGGVRKKAATLLGITFRSIRYRLKKLGVDEGGGE